jgi:signal transduction histidine kinase
MVAMTASEGARPGRIQLVAWSALLSVSAVLALLFGPALVVSLLLVPLRIGVPLTNAVFGGLRGLADLHRLWAVRVLGRPIPRPYRQSEAAAITDPATWRDVRWLPVNATAGLALVGVPAGGTLLGAFTLGAVARFTIGHEGDHHAAPLALILAMAVLGTTWVLIGPAMRAYGSLLHWFLAPAEKTRLADRIAELTETRTEALDTQAAEIRRIERDLHDGAQAKLVALGMNLGMAEKLLVQDPAAALRLLSEAKQSTGHALAELRELVRGIQPPILADRGLDGAAKALVLASPLPIELLVELPGRPPAPVESAVYFALTEILTNVTKHSAATSAWIRIGYRNGYLDMMIADNGMGGAHPYPGGGLHGIQRRLAAFDGTLTVASPTGGPTIVTMEVPCELAGVSS